MTRPHTQLGLSEFDLMVIRAGGRPAAEVESMAMDSFGFRCKTCAVLADALYRIVLTLEASSNRPDATSHCRLSTNLTSRLKP
ncbi:MAG: hypothetical protein ABJI96_11195 [Paracoccaceae bacterium]|uniref:hypothetical protein n=1 Tax=Parasphingorhabdus sp. TaxID=2709688 RepID=UPI0032980F43